MVLESVPGKGSRKGFPMVNTNVINKMNYMHDMNNLDNIINNINNSLNMTDTKLWPANIITIYGNIIAIYGYNIVAGN